MKFLIVGLVNSSQVKRFREEAQKLGHEVEGCFAKDLVIRSEIGKFEASVNGKPLSNWDLIYLCTGIESKRRYEWYIAIDHVLATSHTKVVNEVVVNPSFKYFPSQTWFYLNHLQNAIPMPTTYTVFNGKNLSEITSTLGWPVIVKLSETHQGKGVSLAKNLEDIQKIIAENPENTFLLRQFIPNDGDIRVFTVGYKAIGAMKRIPQEGDFRSNISRGGRGEVFALETNLKVQELAEKVSRTCGIEVAGVDIIIDKTTGEPYVLEVNVGPQFKGLESYTQTNAAGAIIAYFIAKCS